MKRPYRLASRLPLSEEPPFTIDLVRVKIEEALHGPKKGRVTHGEPSGEAIAYLTNALNCRHQFLYAAQQDRIKKERRDRAAELFDELRQIMPEIAADAEQHSRKLRGDFFAAKVEHAAKAVCAVVSGDLIAKALPPVPLPENVTGWNWCAASLHADISQHIGSNAAVRFIAAVAPMLSGETPSPASVRTWLRKRKICG